MRPVILFPRPVYTSLHLNLPNVDCEFKNFLLSLNQLAVTQNVLHKPILSAELATVNVQKVGVVVLDNGTPLI